MAAATWCAEWPAGSPWPPPPTNQLPAMRSRTRTMPYLQIRYLCATNVLLCAVGRPLLAESRSDCARDPAARLATPLRRFSRTTRPRRIGAGIGDGGVVRRDRDHRGRRPLRGRRVVARHGAHGAAGLPVPHSGPHRGDGRRRTDCVSGGRHGRAHDRGELRVHRSADRPGQAQGAWYPDGGSRGVLRGFGVWARSSSPRWQSCRGCGT